MSHSQLDLLARELQALAGAMLDFERKHAPVLARVADSNQASARNLLHYLAMRHGDLRSLQRSLAGVGLSSLGRAEAHALSSVETTLNAVLRLLGESAEQTEHRAPCDLTRGTGLLDSHTTALFGPESHGRGTHIMVTMPSEAASDYTIVHDLLVTGMTCMRINCAHDDPQAWLKMIENLRRACATLDRHCSVLMDLGGPKLRTGAVLPSAAVQKIKPQRDAYGRVTAPIRLWLTRCAEPAGPPTNADAVVQVDSRWLQRLQVGDAVKFKDTRGRRRVMRIVDLDRGGVWAEMKRTAYLTNGAQWIHFAGNAERGEATETSGIATKEGAISLKPNDLLVLTKDTTPGRAASFDSAGRLLSPARVSCTLPEVFQDVFAGERVCLDDGRITGVIDAATESELHVRVRHTPPGGARLKGDKGINLPDSALQLPALTAKDKEDIEFVVQHADMVGLSFANHESDVLELIEQIERCGERRPAIVLKVETNRGFHRLPALLLTAMRHERVGVMIARGDLAVECGYERLAEAQEEILWICEAAHCPAIWATQVLETLAKEGTPSRAEITDAAMGNRAECVMLNKGPHINEAIRVLDDILKRMDAHQEKKRAMLRALSLATEFEFSLARNHS